MSLRPARGLLTVKPVRTQETFAGGRIILTENERKTWAQWQMEVVDVGFPTVCEKPAKCRRPHNWWPNSEAWHYIDFRLTPGAWVIIRPRSIVDTGSEEKLYLVKHEDVLGVFALAELVGQ